MTLPLRFLSLDIFWTDEKTIDSKKLEKDQVL